MSGQDGSSQGYVDGAFVVDAILRVPSNIWFCRDAFIARIGSGRWAAVMHLATGAIEWHRRPEERAATGFRGSIIRAGRRPGYASAVQRPRQPDANNKRPPGPEHLYSRLLARCMAVAQPADLILVRASRMASDGPST